MSSQCPSPSLVGLLRLDLSLLEKVGNLGASSWARLCRHTFSPLAYSWIAEDMQSQNFDICCHLLLPLDGCWQRTAGQYYTMSELLRPP